MKQPVFTGVCTALVTPFLNNDINYPLMEQLIKRQLDSGVEAIVLAGTTGESPTLSDEEKITMFCRAKTYAGNNCTIIAGTGSNSTDHAVRLSQAAQKAGADALLIVSPYYNKANNDGLYSHFQSIAKSVDLPIIMYNVPSRTGVDIPVSVYERLSHIPNIIGVKEASSDITKITKIRNTCGNELYVWTGNDDQIVPVMSMGGLGAVSVLSNICPVETVALAQAALAGDFDTASALQSNLSSLIELLFSEVNPIPVKYAMRHVGFDCGDCRLPLGMIGADLKYKIDHYFGK